MRGFLVLAARILVSGALLFLALRGVNFAAIQSRLSESSPAWILGWMGLSVLVTIVQIFFGALRWREISGPCGAPLHATQAFKFNQQFTSTSSTPLYMAFNVCVSYAQSWDKLSFFH